VNPLPRDKLLGDALWKIFLLRERILIAPWKTCGIPSSFVLVLWKRTLSVCTNHPLMWLERRLLFWCNVRKEARACFNCLDVRPNARKVCWSLMHSLDGSTFFPARHQYMLYIVELCVVCNCNTVLSFASLRLNYCYTVELVRLLPWMLLRLTI